MPTHDSKFVVGKYIIKCEQREHGLDEGCVKITVYRRNILQRSKMICTNNYLPSPALVIMSFLRTLTE